MSAAKQRETIRTMLYVTTSMRDMLLDDYEEALTKPLARVKDAATVVASDYPALTANEETPRKQHLYELQQAVEEADTHG